MCGRINWPVYWRSLEPCAEGLTGLCVEDHLIFWLIYFWIIGLCVWMSFLAIRWIVSKVDIYMYSFRWAFTSFHTKPSSWTSSMYGLERRPKPFSLTIVLKPDFCCILFGKESALSQNHSYASGVSSEDGVHRRRAAHMFWKNSSLSLYDFEVFERNCDQNSSPFRIERFLYASGLGFWRKKYR